jgi:DNA-binding MltR family transcriptional regulator
MAKKKGRGERRADLRRLIRRVPEGEALYEGLFRLADPLWEQDPAKDRAAAIMGATFLEHALKQAIIRCFKPDQSDPSYNYLFDLDEAPYREFAGRTRLARALGVIDENDFEQLEAIRLIRNAFAHTMELVSFQTPEIATYFDELTISGEGGEVLNLWLSIFAPTHSILGSLPTTQPSRVAFVYAVAQFFWKIIIWRPLAERRHALAEALMASPSTPPSSK